MGSDQETVRQAFLELVKRYHPDSGSEEANAQKFQEIEKAYRKLQQKFHAERWLDRRNEGAGEYGLYYKEKKNNDQVPVVELDIKLMVKPSALVLDPPWHTETFQLCSKFLYNYGIRPKWATAGNVREKEVPETWPIHKLKVLFEHTAPQHRQYLSYDGFGTGTPAQRHKQYQKLRASTAIENVYNHRISQLQEAETFNEDQALVVKDKQKAKNIKTRYGIDRLVEDLIQESMQKGEFDNLSGKGKPLSKRQDHYNPYVDLVTHKLNQVMIDNGFMPEWITLQKEIREDMVKLRQTLEEVRARLGTTPMSTDIETQWAATIETFRPQVQDLNGKIGKFNLVVPLLHNQMLLFDLDKEATKILDKPPRVESTKCKTQKTETKTETESLIGMIISMFNR